MLITGTKEGLEEARKEYGGKMGVVFKEEEAASSSADEYKVALGKCVDAFSKFLTSKGK